VADGIDFVAYGREWRDDGDEHEESLRAQHGCEPRHPQVVTPAVCRRERLFRGDARAHLVPVEDEDASEERVHVIHMSEMFLQTSCERRFPGTHVACEPDDGEESGHGHQRAFCGAKGS